MISFILTRCKTQLLVMEEASNPNSEHIAVYSKRWLLLAATCLASAINMFLSKSFGTSNLILTTYFDVSFSQLDWATLGVYAGTTLATPIFGYLCYANKIGFRVMSISGCACLLMSSICIVLTIHYTALFPLMIVVSLLQGVSYCVNFSVGLFFAVLWFPDHQVGFAIAFSLAAQAIGTVTGSLIPPLFLSSPPLKTLAADHTFQHWRDTTHNTILWMYLTLSIVLCLLVVSFWIYAEDLPPKAPTLALHQKRLNSCPNLAFNISLKRFISSTKQLFQDVTYVLCVVVAGVVYNLFLVEVVHVSLLLDDIFNHKSESATRNAGCIALAYGISASVCGFLSAKVLSYHKLHTLQTIIGLVMLFCSCCGLLLSYCLKSLLGFYVSNIAFGASTRITIVSLMEVVTRHTYPKNEALVTVWMAGCGTVILLIITELSRAISTYIALVGALVWMCVLALIVLVLSFFLRPKNTRGEVDELMMSKEEQNELTPLNQ